MWHLFLSTLSPSVSNRVPEKGKQVKQPGQEHEVANCVSIWPTTSLLCVHGPPSAALSAVLQHLPALAASATTQPGLEGGECTEALSCTFVYIHTFYSFSNVVLSLISPSISRFLILVSRCLRQLHSHPTSSSVCAKSWNTPGGQAMACRRAAHTACRYICLTLHSREIITATNMLENLFLYGSSKILRII